MRAGLQLIPYSITGSSEAVVVGNVGVSGIPVQLVGADKRQEAVQNIIQDYPGLIIIDFTLPEAVNGEHWQGRNLLYDLFLKQQSIYSAAGCETAFITGA